MTVLHTRESSQLYWWLCKLSIDDGGGGIRDKFLMIEGVDSTGKCERSVQG
jgi:hypothetical protein